MDNDVTLDLALHPGQLVVFQDPRRYKVVVAGRRWGKSREAVAYAVHEGLRTELNGYDLTDVGVFIIAPTHDQAKRIYFSHLKRALAPLGSDNLRVLENTGRIEILPLKRWIEIRGADKPDSLRGVGLSAVVLDEYADMKPAVWEEIIRPSLADVKGRALFIGTPKGKNHFFNLVEEAYSNPEEWGVWTFKSTDNPFLDPGEIEAARMNMTAEQFRQEFEASFQGAGTGLLKSEWLKMAVEPVEGYYVMTCDLAGFSDDDQSGGKYKRRDEHALVVTKVHPKGRHIKEIVHGRWGPREVAVQILRLGQKYKLRRIGIEKGALLNAIQTYLSERMKVVNYFPEIFPLWHGGKKKSDRIMYGLGAHGQHGRLTVEVGAPWLSQFFEQWLDFPNPKAPDDLIDGAAYADQMADDMFEDLATLDKNSEYYEPLDADAGY